MDQKEPKNNLKARKFPKANYMDDVQKKEDEEQVAYLAEWSRRHKKKAQRCTMKKKTPEQDGCKDVLRDDKGG